MARNLTASRNGSSGIIRDRPSYRERTLQHPQISADQIVPVSADCSEAQSRILTASGIEAKRTSFVNPW